MEHDDMSDTSSPMFGEVDRDGGDQFSKRRPTDGLPLRQNSNQNLVSSSGSDSPSSRKKRSKTSENAFSLENNRTQEFWQQFQQSSSMFNTANTSYYAPPPQNATFATILNSNSPIPTPQNMMNSNSFGRSNSGENLSQSKSLEALSAEDEMGWNTTASLSPDELLQILQPASTGDQTFFKTDSNEISHQHAQNNNFATVDHTVHLSPISNPIQLHPQIKQEPVRAQVQPPSHPPNPQPLPPNLNQQQPASPRKQIEEIHDLVLKISNEMKRLRIEQKQAPIPMAPDLVERISSAQNQVKQALTMSDKHLLYLFDNVKLDPEELHLLLQMQQDIYFLIKQLELFIQELQSIANGSPAPCFGLVITSQPFPESIKQNKAIDEPVSVHLITGPKFDSRPRCVIKAEVLEPTTSNKKKKSSIGLENGEKPVNENGISMFNDLKFPTGTRLNIIRIKFSTSFALTDNSGKIHTIHLESNQSNPLVVKTNENQWYEAEGLLLDSMIFTTSGEVPWPKVMNWLQRRYLNATRQSLQTPVRPLTNYEFHYIKRMKFENKATISQEDFNQFWLWFGPILHRIRYQRHINSLWTKGYICGFLTREEAEHVLKKEQSGTFVIRLSERLDQFVISYQSSNNSGTADTVKHYLVKPDDTHGAKKTLPDFLKGYLELTCILQLVTNTEQRTLRRCEKETAMKEFYSKPSAKTETGYTDAIEMD